MECLQDVGALQGFAETVLARLTSPQQRAEAERHIQELSARCKALQAEKLTLLEKLDKVKQEAETIGVEAQERAAGELRLALKEQEAHLARRWEEMESALRAELAATVEECERREAEAARSCRDADRDLRTTRTKLVEQVCKQSVLQGGSLRIV